MIIAFAIAAVLSVLAVAYLGLRKLGEADEHDRATELDFGITER